MRFVADVGFPVSGVEALRERGHDILVLADQGLERLLDDEVLTLAREEERVLLGFDLDFGELLAGHPTASRSEHRSPVSAFTRAGVQPSLGELHLPHS